LESVVPVHGFAWELTLNFLKLQHQSKAKSHDIVSQQEISLLV